MSIFAYNGGTIIAMSGKDCVGIACDKQFNDNGYVVDVNFNKIFEIAPTIYVAFAGLVTDAITVSQRLKFRKNMFELRENRKITPHILKSMISNMLYEKRFGPYFVQPIVAALDEKGKPFIAYFDTIGCSSVEGGFCAAGTAAEQCLSICESFWEPDLKPDELFETLSQSLINAYARDAGSGYGGFVYIIEKDKVTISELKTRMD